MGLAHESVLSKPEPGTPLEYSTEDSVLKIIGFWLFISTDLILFSCLFATYLILRANTAGGPTEAQLFDVPTFTAETLILLTSSFTCGLATFQMRRGQRGWLMVWLVITILLGLSFVGLEV